MQKPTGSATTAHDGEPGALNPYGRGAPGLLVAECDLSVRNRCLSAGFGRLSVLSEEALSVLRL